MHKNWTLIQTIGPLLVMFATAVQAQGSESGRTTCMGRVVDNDGQPIRRARVVLYYNHSKWGLGNRIVEETESAADGAFAFVKPLSYSVAAGYPYHR
ncbi:MAG: carboxypeptidase regulatory-like domain-containing protein, partial [Phycisphaerales bacterium]